MSIQEEIGLRIKKLREEKKLSQTALADLIGYKDKTAIAKIEAGKVDLPQSKLVAFASHLGTTPAFLLDGNSPNQTNDFPTHIRAAARGMMDLSPEDQKTAIDMINYLSQKGKEAKDN